MGHYAGTDVSLELSSVCVVDVTGRIVREAKVPSEPEALVAWFDGLGLGAARVGLEAGPPSQRLIWGEPSPTGHARIRCPSSDQAEPGHRGGRQPAVNSCPVGPTRSATKILLARRKRAPRRRDLSPPGRCLSAVKGGQKPGHRGGAGTGQRSPGPPPAAVDPRSSGDVMVRRGRTTVRCGAGRVFDRPCDGRAPLLRLPQPVALGV